ENPTLVWDAGSDTLTEMPPFDETFLLFDDQHHRTVYSTKVHGSMEILVLQGDGTNAPTVLPIARHVADVALEPWGIAYTVDADTFPEELDNGVYAADL